MRSTETSGVGGDGFDFAQRLQAKARSTRRRPLADWLAKVSPVTHAVALTAMVAATLFILADLARSLDDTRQRADFAAQFSATAPPGETQFVASALPMMGGTDANTTIVQVAQRGAATYAFAFVIIAAAYRRRAPNPKPGNGNPLVDLVAAIPFGVACWTNDGKLIACNEQFRARLDNGPELRAGVNYKATGLRLLAGGTMHVLEDTDENRVLEIRRPDSSSLLIDERPLAEGGFVTLLTDITERRKTDMLLSSIREEQRILARRYHEEKLKAEAASRSKTAFLAHLSHDIRTPLNHIIGFADLMRHQTYGALGDERYETYVESIKASGDRLLGFFASILDLAELESGERVLQQADVGVDELVVNTTRRYSAQAQRAGVTMTLGAPSGALIRGDRFSLERMLSSVVENAVRYTPSGGHVHMAVYSGNDGVVIEVTDTGIGMSAEKVAAVSQPFAFPDASLTRDRVGSGLGLAIARKIVELSGGNLLIDSRPGLGTTVAITLPLQAELPRINAAA
ncbi:MAG: ATP-binding protein [Devosia sp.]